MSTNSVTPKVALNFTTAALDPRVTFTRTTSATNPATFTNSSGVITAAANNQPRFDYDPVTLACQGLLIEETRANLFLKSQEFLNITWTRENVNVTDNVVASPDGNTNAAKITETIATSIHRLKQAVTVVSGTTYTASFYLKAAEREFAQVRIEGSGQLFGVNVNLTNGASSTVSFGSPTGTNARVTNAGNGWWRTTVTITSNTTSFNCHVYVASALGTISYTGDGTSGIYVWGAQLEAGAFATSYIPTTTTALTRNADVATITGTNFSDFWQASKGGTLVQATPSTVSGISPLIQFDDNTANEIIALRGNTTNPELYIVDGGTPQAQIDAGTIAANTAYSLTGWWQENNSFAQLNTQTSVRDNTVTIPTVTQARLGSDGTNYLNGTIAAIYYYDELANSIYDSLRLLGYTGTVTDMLLQYYLARGATSNSLTDAEIEFLGVKGFTTGTIDDKWTNYLISLGYFGTITDMKYQYWKSPE